jgi:hypothetical protein
MKPNDSNTNLVLPVDPINISNEGSNNRETVVIMTSHPPGHTAIKGSDYIIIDHKGPNIVVERQVNHQLIHEGQHKYNQQTRGSNDSSVNSIASPATEALEYILEDTKSNIHTNLEINNPNMDDNSLLLDLNELLRRDPTFSGLEDSKSGYPTSPPQFISTAPNVEAMNAANININNRQGLAIPGSKHPGIMSSATITSGQTGNSSGGGILQNRINLDMGGSFGSSGASSNEKTAFDHGSLGSTSPSYFPSDPNTNKITKSIPDALVKMDTSALIGGISICTSPSQQQLAAGEPDNNTATIASNPISMTLINQPPSGNHHGPTLAQLNSPTDNDATSGLINVAETGIKMEISDFDDLDLFLSSSSANVSFGLSHPDVKPQVHGTAKQITNPLSPLSHQIKQEPGLNTMNNSSWNNRIIQATNVTPLTNMNFWQATTDEMLFGPSTSGHPSNSSSNTVGGSSTGTGATFSGAMTSLSSSVPVNLFHNVSSPLSDILTDLSPSSGNTCIPSNSSISISGMSPSLRSTISPNGFIIGSPIANPLLSPNTPTPSNAGPTRNSTLHKLLMQRKGDGPITGRPSPVRSPESRKTLEQMKNSLSTSNPLISQQLLSRSAPTSNPIASGNIPMDSRLWTRREPRPHISSVCSVGEASSIADEVNEVLGGLSPNDDLHDIVSDDEEEEHGNYPEYKDSSDGT